MRIKEAYKRSGFFWLPGSEDYKVPGTLSVSSSGVVELEIVGLLKDESFDNRSISKAPRVLAVVELDGYMTLENCVYTKRSIPFGARPSKSTLRVTTAYVGLHYIDKEQPTFCGFSFSIDCLEEWVGISGLEINSYTNSVASSIAYTPQDEISLSLSNGFSLDIYFPYSLPGGDNIRSATISQSTYFILHSDNDIPVDAFMELAHKFVTFVSFAAGRTVCLKDVAGRSNQHTESLGDDEPYFHPIPVIYESLPYTDKEPTIDGHHMLFTFDVIKENAELVFNRWIDAHSTIEPAMNLYFSTRFADKMFLETRFLALAQGLETFHRRTSKILPMRLEEYKALVDKLLDACPPEKIEWLKGRLAQGNEPSFCQRIKQIVQPFVKNMDKKKARSLPFKIAATRNYLTHYSDELREKAATGVELHELCKKMEAVFQLHFLKVIGFTDDEITEVIDRHPTLMWQLS